MSQLRIILMDHNTNPQYIYEESATTIIKLLNTSNDPKVAQYLFVLNVYNDIDRKKLDSLVSATASQIQLYFDNSKEAYQQSTLLTYIINEQVNQDISAILAKFSLTPSEQGQLFFTLFDKNNILIDNAGKVTLMDKLLLSLLEAYGATFALEPTVEQLDGRNRAALIEAFTVHIIAGTLISVLDENKVEDNALIPAAKVLFRANLMQNLSADNKERIKKQLENIDHRHLGENYQSTELVALFTAARNVGIDVVTTLHSHTDYTQANHTAAPNVTSTPSTTTPTPTPTNNQGTTSPTPTVFTSFDLSDTWDALNDNIQNHVRFISILSDTQQERFSPAINKICDDHLLFRGSATGKYLELQQTQAFTLATIIKLAQENANLATLTVNNGAIEENGQDITAVINDKLKDHCFILASGGRNNPINEYSASITNGTIAITECAANAQTKIYLDKTADYKSFDPLTVFNDIEHLAAAMIITTVQCVQGACPEEICNP